MILITAIFSLIILSSPLMAFEYPKEALQLLSLKEGEKLYTKGSSDPYDLYDAALLEHSGRNTFQEIEQLGNRLKLHGKGLVIAPLADSFEHQILTSLGVESVPHMNDYRWRFKENGFKICHLEVQRDLAIFRDDAAAYAWILSDIAPLTDLHMTDYELFAKDYLEALKAGGAVGKNGEIRFPYKQLIALIQFESF